MVHICSDENGGIYGKDTGGSQPLGGTSLEKSWELRGAPEARKWERAARMLPPSPHHRTPPSKG